jgi:alkylated DNA repair dioxygenase AlkB
MEISLENNSSLVYQAIPDEYKMTFHEYSELWNLQPKERFKINIGGRSLEVKRKQQAYGKSYIYSGATNHAIEEIPPIIQRYVDYANSIDSGFDIILVNWYKDGNDYIGYHSDETSMLIPLSPIYCFSFGQGRDFLIKNKTSGKLTKINLENNSLVMMLGNFQKTHKHSIPKRAKLLFSRVSITLRKSKD